LLESIHLCNLKNKKMVFVLPYRVNLTKKYKVAPNTC